MKTDAQEKGLFVLVSMLFLSFGIVLIKTAWLCDDAYIPFRTIDNFINGYGLTWNVAERVQAFTNPLWTLILSLLYYFTHEISYTSIIFSVIVSISAVSLVAFRMASGKSIALLALSFFIFSKAFVDYSTSGLENPLTHLLLVIFLLIYVQTETFYFRSIFFLSLVAALGVLNRMDTLLLFLPGLLYGLWHYRSLKGFIALALGFLPFFLWEFFALFYYGFPFPNTAYAKLNTGIAANELLVQGLHYLRNSLYQDPITIIGIVAGTVPPLLLKRWKLMPISIGMLFYILYVVKIGGDFMSGRFLAAPFIVGVSLLSIMPWRAISVFPALAALWAIGFLFPNPPLLSGGDFGADYTDEEKRHNISNLHKDTNGISDERRFYYPDTSFLKGLTSEKKPLESNYWALEGAKWRNRGKAIYFIDAIGFLGFFAGPDLHLSDQTALSDPLLARLPIGKSETWRIGHFERIIPNGYLETLGSGRNVICDEKLAGYYDKLSLITRGALFAPHRLGEIWNMNSGKYDRLIDADIYSSLDVSHNKKGLTEYTVEELLPLVGRNPVDVYAQYKLGIAYARKGMLDQAIAHFEIAVKLHPNDRCMKRDLERGKELRKQS